MKVTTRLRPRGPRPHLQAFQVRTNVSQVGSNGGSLGAMARIWSSPQSGPVPSKKVPAVDIQAKRSSTNGRQSASGPASCGWERRAFTPLVGDAYGLRVHFPRG